MAKCPPTLIGARCDGRRSGTPRRTGRIPTAKVRTLREHERQGASDHNGLVISLYTWRMASKILLDRFDDP